MCAYAPGLLARMLLRRRSSRATLNLLAGRSLCLRRTISTLHPARLSASEFLDMSARKSASIPVPTFIKGAPICFRGSKDPSSDSNTDYIDVPFPKDTRGFLYYIPGPSHAPAAGEIRFRVTGNRDPASFEGGHDLLYPITTLPWRITLASIARNSTLHSFLHLLQEVDHSVTRSLAESLGQKPTERMSGRSQIIHSPGQPFFQDFSGSEFILWIVTGSTFRRFRVESPCDRRGSTSKIPYIGEAYSATPTVRQSNSMTGTALCTVEPTKTALGVAAMAVRVLKIIRPVKPVDPAYDGYLPAPVEGELLQGAGGRPFFLRVAESKSYAEAAATFLSPNHGYVVVHRDRKYAGRSIRFTIRHLSPVLLSTDDFMDLSGLVAPHVWDHSDHERRKWIISYDISSRGDMTAFPVGCSGFFYYWSGSLGPVGAQLRFRVTGSRDPSSFEAGHDLLLPSGVPWKRNVATLCGRDKVSAVQDVLVRDGVLAPHAIDFWRTSSTLMFNGTSDVVSVGNAFFVDFSTISRTVHIARGPETAAFNWRHPYVTRRNGRYVSQCRGESTHWQSV
jgi:hypothetical protein